MRGEFLLFDFFVLLCVLVFYILCELRVFKKRWRSVVLVTIFAFFVLEFVTLLGFARNWWSVVPGVLVGVSLFPLNLEDVLLSLIAPVFLIILWEVCNKK